MHTDKKSLIFRCYAKKEGSQWVAVCIDLSLAAQADSCNEATEKLELMMLSYVDEALGVHSAYSKQLLSRKAPLPQILFYYFASFLHWSKMCGNSEYGVTFMEKYPLQTA